MTATISPNAPKVSVIVPTYNQETLIARTLDSILSQVTDFKYEIIVGDDHSTDGTLNVCLDYARRFPDIVRVIANEHNKGVRDNYFDCLLQARGKYIADCGGDDFWIDPMKLQKEADILDSDPEISLVHSAWNFYDEPTGKISTFKVNENKAALLKPISRKGELFIPALTDVGGPLIHLCSAMYRRDAFMECYHSDVSLFRNKEFLCEDFQIVVMMARSGKIAYIPDITLNYSVGKPSVMSRDNIEKAFRFYISTIKIINHIRNRYNVSAGELSDCYRHRLHYLLTLAFRLRDKKKRDEVASLFRLAGITPSMKSRLLLAISAINPLWKLAIK